jgi:peptidyl-tRNA hydrolase, PTH1 family
MKLIVGLGNPGSRYEGTRHNIGFDAVEALGERLKLGGFRNESKFKAEVARGEFNGEKIILARPQTYMNLSGEAVLLLKQFYKIENEDLWLAYDDVDLALGVLRLREAGSAGTHNGVKSVLQLLSSEDLPRFKLGIENRGNISPVEQDIASFVLERFRNEERFQVEELVKVFVESAVHALKKGFLSAREKFSQ